MADKTTVRGFLASLRRDVRGNTIAMMAAALIPISAMAGSAVDMARLYVVKVRLQQACDAGVLAGRKFMTDTSTTTPLDANATAQAQTFFSNNFKASWMKTNTVVFTPTKASNSQVAGTATAVVPMTVTKMFGAADTTVSVSCMARYDVADTDVMFVLDTTGSMSCLPGDSDAVCNTYVGAAGNNTYTRPTDSTYSTPGYSASTGYSVPEKTGSRIEALRQAVLGFYDTFAANADPSTHVRYGFVTYTSTVNAGKAITSLSSSYMVGGNGSATVNYDSRKVTADYNAGIASETANGKTQGNCTAAAVRSPSTALTYNSSSGMATSTYDEWVNTSATNTTKICKTRVDNIGPQWTYGQYSFDVSQFVAGNTVDDPTKVTTATSAWRGCVEERIDASSAGQTVFTTASLPADLDPDLVPSSDSTRWRPKWEDVVYGRNSNNGFTFSGTGADTSNGDDDTGDPNYGTVSKQKYGYVTCGKPVRRLTTWARTDVYNYLYANDFVPIGGTYHDTGMIWGTRMISPSGLFSADTSAWPGRNPPNRVIVFMTDGDMAPTTNTYSMYGLEYFDKRVTNGDYNNIINYHNARFLAECSAAKARNIDVWTVSIDTSASSQMQSCATTTAQALFSTTGTGLSAAFTSIAQHLAMLRITQ